MGNAVATARRGTIRRGDAWSLGDLAQEERIAPRRLEHPRPHVPVADALSEQHVRLLPAQRFDGDPDQLPLAHRRVRRQRPIAGHHARAMGDRNQHRAERGAPHQVAQQLQRRLIAPVCIVEHQHQGIRRPKEAQQRTHRPMNPITLLARQPRRRQPPDPGQRRKRRRELPDAPVPERPPAPRVHRRQVIVERVDEDMERDILLELRRAATKNKTAGGLRALRQRFQQPRLADPRLPDELGETRLASPQRSQDVTERAKLVLPSDQRGLSRTGRAVRIRRPAATVNVAATYKTTPAIASERPCTTPSVTPALDEEHPCRHALLTRRLA